MSVKQVSTGIIRHNGRILIGQRKRGKPQEFLWEFPGGKQEPGETMPECLYRELKEEFGLETEIGDFIMTSPYDYETGSIVLHAYFVSAPDAEIKKLDAHEQYKWVTIMNLRRPTARLSPHCSNPVSFSRAAVPLPLFSAGRHYTAATVLRLCLNPVPNGDSTSFPALSWPCPQLRGKIPEPVRLPAA